MQHKDPAGIQGAQDLIRHASPAIEAGCPSSLGTTQRLRCGSSFGNMRQRKKVSMPIVAPKIQKTLRLRTKSRIDGPSIFRSIRTTGGWQAVHGTRPLQVPPCASCMGGASPITTAFWRLTWVAAPEICLLPGLPGLLRDRCLVLQLRCHMCSQACINSLP